MRKTTPKHNSNDAMRFMGIGTQLLVTIAVGTYIGHWADARLQNNPPYLTVLGALLSVFAGIYMVIKAVSGK
jgi:ATP synthase protein I